MATTREVGRYGLMKLIDVMSQNPITVTASETIGQADEIMSEHRFRQLPVVDGNKLLGIITDRDIRSFLSGSLYSTTEAREKALQTKIADVMTTEPLTLAPDDELPAAVELLIDEKIGGIPIVDEVEGLVGIVTYVDVLRCFMHRLQEE
jgi:acetoin utilization protein AcuB